MSSEVDLSNLFVEEGKTWQLADHSVLEARQTFAIPDTNSSQNIKDELEEIWGSNKSYGLFSLIENTGGLHEFMPDPEKSQFVPERDLPKVASSIVVRAKRALMKGVPVQAVFAEVERRIPANVEYQKYFVQAKREIEEAAGLIGTVYIDPSLFSSCAEGLRFMATAKVKPAYVLELTDCKKCVYKCGANCALFGKRIEARIPWQDRAAMTALLNSALTTTGTSLGAALKMKAAGLSMKEIVRGVFLGPSGEPERQREYKGDEKERPLAFDKPLRNERDYSGAAFAALARGLPLEGVMQRVLAKTQSWVETVRVLKAAITEVGCLKQNQLPCPACEAPSTSKRAKRVAAVLPRTMAIVKQGVCGKCGRSFETHINFWGRPFVLPGMASDVIRRQATAPGPSQGPSQGVIWEQSQAGPYPSNKEEEPEHIPVEVLE